MSTLEQPGTATPDEWSRFCLRLSQLGERLRETAPDEQSREMVKDYLARLTVHGLEREFFGKQRLQAGLNCLTPRIGGYNPDNRMAQASLDPRRSYRLSGRLNDAYRLSIVVYTALPGGDIQLDAAATQRSIDVDAQGYFELMIETGAASRNRLPLQPTSNMLLLRELDLHPGDKPAELKLECLGGISDPAAGPGIGIVTGSLAMAGQFIEVMAGRFLQWAQRIAEFQNRMMQLPEDLNQAMRGDTGTLYYVGSFNLADDQALDIEIPAVTCDYWGLALTSYWLEPLPSHLNHATAQADPDGICRVRLSRHANTGAARNVMDTAGLQRGTIWHRTTDADRQAVPVVRMSA